jgi:branched-chain amino acid transport system ATP-binding protein
MRTEQPFLSVERLTKNFGGVLAVSDVSFEVMQGSITGLIGPNGAGKTTTFNLISGRFPPTAGCVRLNGQTLTGLRPDRIAARGVARTFQGTRIFLKLTVTENVKIAVLAGVNVGYWQDWLGLAVSRQVEANAERRTAEILDWIGLSAQQAEKAGSLAYAHQSLLGIGLALALQPQLLLLDEPFAGMNPGETMKAAEMVRRIRESGITVVLVEHDVPAVMKICDRIVVLEQGTKIAEGAPDEIRADPRVVEAYLGVDANA